MKTNREILEQFNIEPSDFLDPNDYLKVEAAMNERASQALDEAANSVKLKQIAGVQPESFTSTFEVDRDSILNLKSKLK